jgi:phosphatidylglycerol:prolipoprotein diacylglycerol transferase
VHPELFKIPGISFHIYSYSIVLGLAIYCATYLTSRLAEESGIPSGRIYGMACLQIPVSVIGAKLVGAGLLSAGPVGISAIVHAPLYCLIAFLIGTALLTIEVRLRSLPWLTIVDAAAPGAALAAGLGRVGCFAAGCCWGRPTSSWLGISFGVEAHQVSGTPVGIPLMPTQLIEAVTCLSAGLWLLHLWNKRTFQGQVALGFMVLYALERLLVEFWRDDPRVHAGSLSLSQLLSLAIIIPASVSYLWLRSRRDKGLGHISG